MPTNKQRREAARRHLERQLQRREEREAARKRFTLVASIVGTVFLIALVTIFIVVVSHDDKKKAATASDNPTVASPTPTPPPSARAPARAARGASVSFQGVTVKGAADLGGAPGVTLKASTAPTKLAYKDLVIGKGNAATLASSVTIQYVGVLYKSGKVFDSSWATGQPARFSLADVVKGFTQAIGGTTGVPAMKTGGRRLMILPASLAYGTKGKGPIPPNAPLVFVVDLKAVSR